MLYVYDRSLFFYSLSSVFIKLCIGQFAVLSITTVINTDVEDCDTFSIHFIIRLH